MRLDSPACIQCKLENITLNNDTIQLNSFGIISDQPIRWHLDIPLLENILVNESSYKTEVGTISFYLTKVNKGLWHHLLLN